MANTAAEERMNVAARPFNVVSLAAGAGGLDLAVKLALDDARLVCAVEIEAFAAAILAARMDEGALDDAPIWSDVRTFDGRPWRGRVHCVTAGYPCQPFSSAGKRRGTDDPRHLWPHVKRIIDEIDPDVAFLENVEGHLSLGLDIVRGELLKSGRTCEVGLFTARETGANQIRKRVFILSLRRSPVSVAQGDADEPFVCREPSAGQLPLAQHDHGTGQGQSIAVGQLADAAGARCDRRQDASASASASDAGAHRGRRVKSERARGTLADAERGGHGRLTQDEGRGSGGRTLVERPSRSALDLPTFAPGPSDADAWREVVARDAALVPAVRGMADELAGRVDRIRLGGNGVHPLEGAHAFRTLLAIEDHRGHAIAADLLSRSDEHLRAFAEAAGQTEARGEAKARSPAH